MPEDPDQPVVPSRAARHKEQLIKAAEEAKGRASAAMGQAQEARKSNAFLDVVFRTGEHDLESGGSLVASALAFRFFLMSLPLVLLIVMVVGVFAGGPQAAAEMFSSGGIGGMIASSVAAAQDVSFLGWIVTVVGAAIATLWTGYALTKALNQSSRFAWDMEYRPLRGSATRTGIVIGMIVALLLIVPFLGFVHGETGFLLDVVVTLLGMVGTGLLWWIILLQLQRPEEVPSVALLPGAIIFGAVLQVLRIVTGLWVGYRASAATDTYGDLGNAVALLAWLAILGRAAVASSTINVALWERAHGSKRRRGAVHERAAR